MQGKKFFYPSLSKMEAVIMCTRGSLEINQMLTFSNLIALLV